MACATQNNYDGIARCYDGLAHLFSLGQIRACKRWQLRALAPGDRVLYAGAGRGEDAAHAARHGARVTVVDLSPAMLSGARKRFRAEGLEDRIEVVCGDVFAFRREGLYDAVAANFFLNVFPEQVMRAMLAHLVRQVRPGGRVLIADFVPPSGNALLRGVRRLYFGSAVLAFRVLAGNALHPIYDYPAWFPEAGLRLEESRGFSLLGVGPAFYLYAHGRALSLDGGRHAVEGERHLARAP